jgi:hypothetical protein
MASLEIKNGNGDSVYLDVTGTGTVLDPYKHVQSISKTGEVKTNFVQDFDTVGDGSGITNMNVDGSGTTQNFFIKPNAGEIIRISRVLLSIRDTGTFDSGGWGNNGGTPLTNGLKMYVSYSGGADAQINGAVKSHYELASVMYDFTHFSFGSGDEFAVSRFSFDKFGDHVRLIGDNNDYIKITVEDNLTGLVDQRVKGEGYYE